MLIKPVYSLQKDYHDISAYCIKENKPVCLTDDGESDLVIMSMDAYNRREEILNLREKLLEAEIQHAKSAKTYSIKETNDYLTRLIDDYD